MSHSHTHSHSHSHHDSIGNNLKVAFFLNFIFAIIELFGGIWTGSIAILSDSLHDLGDSLSLAVAWRLQLYSTKGSDHKYSYGYKRFSLLGAMITSIILLVGSCVVIYSAIGKIIHPEQANAKGMILLAIFGLIVNGIGAFKLSRGHSITERSVMLHLMEDVLGWAAVLVVAVVMCFVDVPILDPLLSLCISVWILYNVYFNFKDTFRIILQGVPMDVDQDAFEKALLLIEGVESLHDLHLWTLDGTHHIGSVHVVLASDYSCDIDGFCELKSKIRNTARLYKVDHITIEIDTNITDCGCVGCGSTITADKCH